MPTPSLPPFRVRSVPEVILLPSKKLTPLVVCVVALVPPLAMGSAVVRVREPAEREPMVALLEKRLVELAREAKKLVVVALVAMSENAEKLVVVALVKSEELASRVEPASVVKEEEAWEMNPLVEKVTRPE